MEKKCIIIFLVFLLNFSLIFGFRVCNYNFAENGLDFKLGNNKDSLYIDKNGNVLIHSKKFGPIYSRLKIFSDSNNLIFSTFNSGSSFQSKKFNNNQGFLNEFDGSKANERGFRIRNSNGNIIAFLSKETGDIYSSGVIIYDEMGRKKNNVYDDRNPPSCKSDGKKYCASYNRKSMEGLTSSTSSEIEFGWAENRDYFCDILGEKRGVCKYDVIETEDCDTFEPYYVCHGNYKYIREPVCSSGRCTYDDDYVTYCGSSHCARGHTEYYSCRPYSCHPHKCNPYNCRPYSCNPHSCGKEGKSTCYDTCYHTCYHTCYDTCYRTCSRYVCDIYHYMGCSGGECYSYYS